MLDRAPRHHRRDGRLLAPVVALVLLALVLLAAGCGGVAVAPSPSASSAAAAAAAILGHPATGLAASVVHARHLVIGIDPDYPPQSSVDPKTREPVGFNVDVAKAIASRLGLRVSWRYLSASAVPGALATHKVDVAVDSVPDTPDDRERMGLSDPYCSTLGQVFMARGGTPVTGAGSLDGKTVGVAAATVFCDYLLTHTKATVAMFPDDTAALAALLAGKTDYWMTAAQTGQAAIAGGAAIAAAGRPLMSQALVCAVGRHEKDLLALVDAAIADLRSSGRLSALSRHWYGMDLTAAR